MGCGGCLVGKHGGACERVQCLLVQPAQPAHPEPNPQLSTEHARLNIMVLPQPGCNHPTPPHPTFIMRSISGSCMRFRMSAIISGGMLLASNPGGMPMGMPPAATPLAEAGAAAASAPPAAAAGPAPGTAPMDDAMRVMRSMSAWGVDGTRSEGWHEGMDRIGGHGWTSRKSNIPQPRYLSAAWHGKPSMHPTQRRSAAEHSILHSPPHPRGSCSSSWPPPS